MKLYHFTSAKHGLGAIRDQRFKLSTYDSLNDPFELYATELSDPLIRESYRSFKSKVIASTALLCCSKSWHNTLLWSHYADKHRGVALELEVDPKNITNIIYRRTRRPITREAMDADVLTAPGKGIGAKILKIKSADWSYEDEARIFFGINGMQRPKDGLYFHPFDNITSLKGVILGPLCKLDPLTISKAAPASVRLSVSRARVAFRSFRVVKDRSFSPMVIEGSA